MKINYSQLISNNLLANSSNNLLLLCVWLSLTNKKWKKRKIGKCQVWKAKLWNIILNWESCLFFFVLHSCSNIICFNVYFIIKHIILTFIKLFAVGIFCTYFWFHSFVFCVCKKANKKSSKKKKNSQIYF